MTAHISIADGRLTIHRSGVGRLLGPSVDVPVTHVVSAGAATPEDLKVANNGVRLAGILIPGLMTSGIFWCRGQLAWWDVGRGNDAIIVTLRDERLARVVVGVDDRGAVQEALENALAPGDRQVQDSVDAGAEPTQFSIGRLLALHLFPGMLATLIFVLVAPIAERLGYPPLAAFLTAIAIGIVPFELAVVLLASRKAQGRGPAAIPYRRPLRRRDWLVLVPVVLVAAIIGFGVVALIDGPIRDALFGWLPTWFVAPVPLDSITDYSRSAWTVTLVGFVILNAILGPVTEELYFRGYLLPRMSQFGRWAPLLNVVLFSLYHFWSPWQLFSRIAGVLPFAYAVWWKENVFLGIAVHALLNTISVVTVVALVMAQLG